MEHKISILFSILREFIISKKIKAIAELETYDPQKIVFVLIDSFGLKEFNYLSRNSELFNAENGIMLFNPFPSTKMAYRQIFFQGKNTIFDILLSSSKSFGIIDNRFELSLFPHSDNILKAVRKSDGYALSKATELLKTCDIVWVHLMNLDHLYHSGIKSARKYLLEFCETLRDFISSLESGTLCLIFGDHGKHHLKTRYYGKNPREKREFYRELTKMKCEASRTVLYPIFVK